MAVMGIVTGIGDETVLRTYATAPEVPCQWGYSKKITHPRHEWSVGVGDPAAYTHAVFTCPGGE